MRRRCSGLVYAVKVLDKEPIRGKRQQLQARTECNILQVAFATRPLHCAAANSKKAAQLKEMARPASCLIMVSPSVHTAGCSSSLHGPPPLGPPDRAPPAAHHGLHGGRGALLPPEGGCFGFVIRTCKAPSSYLPSEAASPALIQVSNSRVALLCCCVYRRNANSQKSGPDCMLQSCFLPLATCIHLTSSTGKVHAQSWTCYVGHLAVTVWFSEVCIILQIAHIMVIGV